MKIKKFNRKFKPSKNSSFFITEKAKIFLENNEQITMVDKFKNEYDVVKKNWGYYATPSINKRLIKNNYHTYLVKNKINNTIFLHLVNKKKKKQFYNYLKKHKIKILKWIKQNFK